MLNKINPDLSPYPTIN